MSRADDALLLGVGVTVSAESLKAAFRVAAMGCHPDLAGEGCREEFVQLREAYERLRDGYWDRVDKASERTRQRGPVKPRSTGRRQTARTPDFIDFFDAALKDIANQKKGRRVLDEIELAVPFDYLLFGASLTIYVPVEMACRTCHGKGMVPDLQGVVSGCPTCHGDRVSERQLKVPLNLPPGLRAGHRLYIPLDESGLKGYDVLVEISLAP